FAKLHPQDHPDYLEQLSAFLDLLASHGLRCEFTVFADAQIIMPSVANQRVQFNHVCEVLRDKWNVFLELANEFPHPTNRVDPQQFAKPAGIVASRGSG